MTTQAIFDLLKKYFADDILEKVTPEAGDEFITVNPSNILEIANFCRDYDDLDFDYLTLLSGIDAGEQLCVVYHLYSLTKKHTVVLKAFVPKDNPTLHTVERIWRAADWHERETFDMFGVIFEGHHNLIRILSPYDWEGYPLRKDYQTPEEYHGMRIPY